MSSPLLRDHRFNMLLSEHEENMLRALAEADGLTASDFLRSHIRRAFAEKFGEVTWGGKPTARAAKKSRGR